ncbi:MAG: hypothetical protein LBG48_00325 [Rickettsiales bacterium]|jgi:hypothetical protein|nr:hypothetical protein [Rickettsiales bacterium]
MGGKNTIFFDIKKYKPSELPVKVFLDILGDFVKLIGNSESIHFVDIKTNSTCPEFYFDNENEFHKAVSNLDGAAKGAADVELTAAYRRINNNLRKNSTYGYAKCISSSNRVVKVDFKGIKEKIEQDEIVLSDKWEVDGFIKRIGGKDKTIPVNILDPSSGEIIYNCETNIATARELKKYLLEDVVVRMSGEARWKRLVNGCWELIKFNIKSVDEISNISIIDTVNGIRLLQSNMLNKIDNCEEYFRKNIRFE